MITHTPSRKNGQILNCQYGYHWPLNLYTTGFVRLDITTGKRGKPKIRYTWAATRTELLVK